MHSFTAKLYHHATWTSFHVGTNQVDPSEEFTKLLELNVDTDDGVTVELLPGLGWMAFGSENYDSVSNER